MVLCFDLPPLYHETAGFLDLFLADPCHAVTKCPTWQVKIPKDLNFYTEGKGKGKKKSVRCFQKNYFGKPA